MTRRLIQKYGGSVLTDDTSMRRAAREIARAVGAGDEVVAVVSALGSVTDALISRARGFCAEPAAEALDLLLATGELQSAALLAVALGDLGIAAEAVNPWQMGVHTDGRPGIARITRINPIPLATRLAAGRVVVVPGFVGRADDDRVTTLGRGGSDLTAVALADALDAGACEFFKDVPGYFSADPAVVAGAVHRAEVTIAEARELSHSGCRFLQDHALDWAARCKAAFRLRAFDDPRATTIVATRSPDAPPLTAITHQIVDGHGLVSLVGSPALVRDAGVRTALLDTLAQAGVRAEDRGGSDLRVTLGVPAGLLTIAERVLHDRFVLQIVHHAGR